VRPLQARTYHRTPARWDERSSGGDLLEGDELVHRGLVGVDEIGGRRNSRASQSSVRCR
jgi:hypothetical protein